MSDLTIDAPWLRPEDVGQGINIKFLDQGHQVSREESGLDNDTFEITVGLPNSEKRVWTMNKTSQRAVAKQYGMENTAWVGKVVRLVTTQQNVRGVMKSVVYVEGATPPTPPKTAPPVGAVVK